MSLLPAFPALCEAAEGGSLATVFNAASGSALVFAAAWAVRVQFRLRSGDGASWGLLAVTAALGVAMMAAHFLHSPLVLAAAAGLAVAFAMGYVGLAFHRLLGLSSALAFAGAVLLAAAVLFVWLTVPSAILAGGAGYLPAVAGLYVIGATLVLQARLALHEDRALTGAAAARSDAGHFPRLRAGYALMQAGVVLTFALVARALDLTMCSIIPIGMHALWHGLLALTVLILLVAMIHHTSPASRSAG